MTKPHQKDIFEFLKDSLKERKIAEWQMAYAKYIEVSNRLSDENGSALDQWRAF